MHGVRSELRALFTKKATLMQRSLGVVSKLGDAVRDGVDGVVVGWCLGKLGRDGVMQGVLSEGVVEAVTRKCWRRRWVRSEGQRLEMRRFVGFVVGRYVWIVPFVLSCLRLTFERTE